MGNTSSGAQKKAAKAALTGPPRNVLLIGASGTGKTLLLRRMLQRQTAASSDAKDDTSAQDSHAFYCTAPTTGMERISLHCTTASQSSSKAAPPPPPTAVDVTICELGGSMSSTWSQYYKTSQTVIYCIDRSAGAAMKWSTAVVHLNTLLTHADISKETAIIILMHQTSNQRVAARVELEAVLQIPQFIKFAKAGQRVDVVECNASSGDGVEALMQLIAR